ncbi:MAG: hypothetical protein ACI9U2_001550 [Bradymonadia bacterium]|jgi:hypothetical protein
MTDAMRIFVLLFSLLPCSFLMVGPGVAVAQVMVEDAEAQARTLGRDGGVAFRNKSYDVALAKFLAAWKLVHHPNLAVNIGRTYEKLGDLEKALAFCRRTLEAPELPPTTEQAATECIERIRPQISDPIFEIRTTPPGAAVRVDGQVKGKSPWRGEIRPGKRQIDVSLVGFRAETRTRFAARGKDETVRFVLVPAAVGGVLTIITAPEGVDIVLDGELIGITPLEGFGVVPKRYVMELRKDGYRTQAMQLPVEDGAMVRREIAMIADNGRVGAKRPAWPAWALMGTGLAVGTVGGVFGYRALTARDQADTLARSSVDPADERRYREHVDAMQTSRSLSDVLIGTGSVLVVGGLVWLLWPQ